MFHVFPVGACRNPQEDDAKFLEFSKKADHGPSGASRLSKTNLPNTQNIPCITRQSPKTRKYSRVGWESGTLQSCSLSQDREILLHQRIYFVL